MARRARLYEVLVGRLSPFPFLRLGFYSPSSCSSRYIFPLLPFPATCLFSFFSVVHRSGKDPPRVALHERVVDEESVKLALRQHYLAGYRCLGCLVISSLASVLRSKPPARRNEN